MNRKRIWQWVEVSAIVFIWGLVAFVLTRVVPIYDDVFSDFGGNFPAPTELLFRAGRFMQSW